MLSVIPAPDPVAAPAAPDAAMVVPDTPGSVDDGDHSYVATFTTVAGETDPSPASAVVNVADQTVNGQVEVTLEEPEDDTVTGWNLYRTVAGDVGNHKLVANIPLEDGPVFVDDVADGSLGADAPTGNTAGGTAVEGGVVLAQVRMVASGGGAATAVIRETDGAGRILAKLAALDGQADQARLPVRFSGRVHVLLTGDPTCLLYVP